MYIAAAELTQETVNMYAIGLWVAGAIMVLLGIIPLKQSTGARVINAVVGLAAIGYGVYVRFFVEEGDTVWLSYYMFILPVLLIINAFRSRKQESSETSSTPSA